MVLLLAAALAGAIMVAVHYRDEVSALRQVRPARPSAPPRPARARPVPPTLVSEMSTLPSSGPLTVQVTVFTARSSAGLAQVIVTARISGGRPHSRYELVGGDCAGNSAWAWVAGFTDARGAADLTGHVVTVSLPDEYSLILSGPGLGQSHPGPALHGYFGIARGLSAVGDGFPPCAP
jgi:hypothetical protein